MQLLIDVSTEGNLNLFTEISALLYNISFFFFRLQSGACPECSDSFNNETPIHLASENNQLEAVKFLIEKGAKVDALTNDHETPLMYAVWNGALETVQVLIESGADMNILNSNSETIFHLAAEKNKTKIFKVLITRNSAKIDPSIHRILQCAL